MRRIAIIASASGNGKTTLGRRLAERLDVPFVELDSLVHGPSWQETSDVDLRRRLEPILASDGWVIDGTYLRKLGTAVLDGADAVVWGRESLFGYALTQQHKRRRDWPRTLARYSVVRLRSQAEVENWLAGVLR